MEAMLAFRRQRAEASLARLRLALRCADIAPPERLSRRFQTAGASLLYGSGFLGAAIVGKLAAVDCRWLGSVVGCLSRPDELWVPFYRRR